MGGEAREHELVGTRRGRDAGARSARREPAVAAASEQGDAAGEQRVDDVYVCSCGSQEGQGYDAYDLVRAVRIDVHGRY
jgi:hypothetical protein